MSIAISIFNFILTEIKISGETGDSFYAVAAADQALEKGLYVGIQFQVYPDTCPDDPTGADRCREFKDLAIGSCYILTVAVDNIAVPPKTTLTAIGKYPSKAGVGCTAEGVFRQSTRSLQTSYQ